VEQSKTKLVGVIAIALLVVGGTGAAVILNRQDESPNSTETSSTVESTPSTSTPSGSDNSTSDTYADGDYTANGSYRTPGGIESVDVSLSLAGNEITDVDVQGSGSGDSARYQSMFREKIADIVVGKNIDEIDVSRVSGSSLTSTGFNEAVETIRQEAASAA